MQAVAHTAAAVLATGTVIPLHAPKAYTGRRGTAPLILNIGARRRSVVDITPQPLYHPLDRRLGGPHNRSARHALILRQPYGAHTQDNVRVGI